MAITVITVALGILLLSGGLRGLRYRDRLERVRQRELERLKRAALTDSLSGARQPPRLRGGSAARP